MFNYEKDKTYILACSFGPDSMALFDMLLKNDFTFVVAHVNYHKRAESDFEETSLRNYCKKNNVICEVYSANQDNITGNFQAWARSVRYDFFRDIYNKYKASGLFVAHHRDDALETYLMQISRKSDVKFYGISENSIINEMKVYRPLLEQSKESLISYCVDNSVPYAIDLSNHSDLYTRNRVRHHIVEKMSESQKNQVTEEMKTKNKALAEVYQIIDSYPKNELDISSVLKETDDTIIRLIQELPYKNSITHSISKNSAYQILNALKSSKPNIILLQNNRITLSKEYNLLKISKKTVSIDYNYIVNEPKELTTEGFILNLCLRKGYINSSDFPLTVRLKKPGDKVMIGSVNKNVSRLFIDWKMPTSFRVKWPIVINKMGKIVYVPKYPDDLDNGNIKILIKSL